MEIIKLSAIDSTNTYLKTLIREKRLSGGLVVVAESQTKGRGMFGTAWRSEKSNSLTFSIFEKFLNLSSDRKSYLNFAVALGMKQALEELEIPKLSIKWPNDILSANKKLSGILIEPQLLGTKIQSAVMGIGLNVNETKFKELPQATSMYLTTDFLFDRDKVLLDVCNAILAQLKRLEAQDYAGIKYDYEASLFRINVWSEFENSNGSRFSGRIRGVDNDGRLRIDQGLEEEQHFALKSIKLIY